MKNRISVLLLVLLLVSSLTLSVFAHEAPDLTKPCSLHVAMRYGDTRVNGGTLSCIRVGYVKENGGDYSFCRVVDDLPLTELQAPNLAEELKFFAESNGLAENVKPIGTQKAGEVTFENLEAGVYLVLQREPAKGYNAITPFLVTLPYYQDGAYVYNVDASAKTELEKEPAPTKPTTPPTEPNIPQTGQLKWPVPLLAIVGMLVFALGWSLFFNHRKDSNEA